jgi:Protein of unknown function (DUF4019)
MMHKALSVFALIVVLAVARPAQAQEPDTKAARTAVDAWLTLVDTGKYAQSWETAATFFKNAVPSQKWEAGAKTARGPFGAFKSRTLKSATTATTLPGAPDGAYVVFDFDATYENKASATERVTAVREKDGSWRVVGYFIK